MSKRIYMVLAALLLLVLIVAGIRQAQAPVIAAADGPTICIDPGHPSETNPGAQLQNGLREVEVTYDIALLLQKILEDELHARVILTRDFREYDPKHPRTVTNRRRAEIANAAGADLFLRLHCDTGKGRGFTLYYPDRQATKNGITGPSAAVRQASAQYARGMRDGIAEVLADDLRDNGVKGESATFIGKKQGALTGSIFSEVPAVTVEMVFLSDPGDAKFIGSKDGQARMAKALAAGIRRSAGEAPPPN